MKYDQIKEMGDEKFRRSTGVKRKTFCAMVEILSKADNVKKSRGERNCKMLPSTSLYISILQLLLICYGR
jgi:hypothetical protein